MKIFSIKDRKLLNEQYRLDNDHYDKSLNDASQCNFTYQMKRIFFAPLQTKNAKSTRITSWKGRVVCVLKLGQTLPLAPYQMIKNVFVIISFVGLLFLNLLNIPFSSNARQDTYRLFKAVLGSCCSLLLRPIVMVTDVAKLSLGAIVSPSLAIKHVKKYTNNE